MIFVYMKFETSMESWLPSAPERNATPILEQLKVAATTKKAEYFRQEQ
jgi:hypothetical protein